MDAAQYAAKNATGSATGSATARATAGATQHASSGGGYRRIVVVGGGPAGWMAATALATALPGSTVEWVESEEIGIIGEPTFPSIRAFHKILGIDEAEFLRATNGIYKLGIEFCDWRVQGERYFHTFGDYGPLTGSHSLWGQHRRLADAGLGTLSEQCLPNVMASQGRFKTPPEQAELYSYAYHFDAVLYAGFLRTLAERRGVRRIEGSIVEVTRHADGGVNELRLADGRVVERWGSRGC